MNEQKRGRPDRPLKRVVVREEFVSLVKNYCREPSKKKVTQAAFTAILLAQLLYWETKCRDYDAFRMEEQERIEHMNQIAPSAQKKEVQPPTLTYGWIYKSAQELSEETMFDLSETTIMRHLHRLLSIGVLEKRNNPHYSWDRCLQYRVNTIRLRQLLFTLGYKLEGWPILPEKYRLDKNGIEMSSLSGKAGDATFPESGDASFKNGNASSNLENRTSQNAGLNPKIWRIEPSKMQDRTRKFGGTIPDTTLQITAETTHSEITSQITPEKRIDENESITTTTASASGSPNTETVWDTLAESPQGKDLIAVYECSVHPIKEKTERNALMSLMKEHGSARVQVALWRAQTLGHRDLFSSMKDFLAFWKDLERRNQNGTTNGNDGGRRADSSAADRPLSQAEQNELRLLEIRERACNGHYTEADAREAERLLYC